MSLFSKETFWELFRFCVVGITAVAITYAIYLLLLPYIDKSISYTIGYVVSFCFNYWATSRFTFHKDANKKNGIGFAGAHLFNYFLQIGLLNFFIWLGVPKEWAPLPMFCIAVPSNFLIVRFVFNKFSKQNNPSGHESR
ncbi:MAG: GtrA family protein [Prevotella sp.]|nr:GtrA family protein [Prevotella sp.]